eukprot:scaffold2389_cov262-Pinguiococcus_pyrenoidosus.AAC.16
MLLVPRIGHERIVGADSVSTANADYPGGLGAGPEDFLSTGFTHGDGDGAGAGAAAAMAAADEDDDHDDDDHDDDDDDDDFGDDDINWEDDDLEEVRGKCCGAKEADTEASFQETLNALGINETSATSYALEINLDDVFSAQAEKKGSSENLPDLDEEYQKEKKAANRLLLPAVAERLQAVEQVGFLVA